MRKPQNEACLWSSRITVITTLRVLSIDNYNIVRHDRNRHGGGVLIYVDCSLSHSLVFSGSPDLELIIISVNFPLSKIVIGLFYHPPNAPSPVFDNLLTSLCTHVDVSLFSNFILLGEFS